MENHGLGTQLIICHIFENTSHHMSIHGTDIKLDKEGKKEKKEKECLFTLVASCHLSQHWLAYIEIEPSCTDFRPCLLCVEDCVMYVSGL